MTVLDLVNELEQYSDTDEVMIRCQSNEDVYEIAGTGTNEELENCVLIFEIKR